MAKINTGGAFQKRPKVSRPGVHAKTKTSKSKNSVNYKKTYKGQGR
jgi:hypothetical protein